MKKPIALLLLCFMCCAVSAQSILKVVPILPEQSRYLSGETHATNGAISRAYLKVNLPPNTVAWYYTFYTTSAKGQKTAPIRLAEQLRKVLDTTGKTDFTPDTIRVPTGTANADIYVFPNAEDANKFKNKEEGDHPILSATRKNEMQETVAIKEILKGSCYIGLRAAGTQGANILIEVAAIVKETPKSVAMAENYGNSAWKEYLNGQFDKCIEDSKKALALDSNLSWVQFNIALTYLVTGKDALDSYVLGIRLNKNSDKPRQNCLDAIDKMDAADKKYTQLKDFDLIRQVLYDESDRLR